MLAPDDFPLAINGHTITRVLEGERAGGTTYYRCRNEDCDYHEYRLNRDWLEDIDCPATESAPYE